MERTENATGLSEDFVPSPRNAQGLRMTNISYEQIARLGLQLWNGTPQKSPFVCDCLDQAAVYVFDELFDKDYEREELWDVQEVLTNYVAKLMDGKKSVGQFLFGPQYWFEWSFTEEQRKQMRLYRRDVIWPPVIAFAIETDAKLKKEKVAADRIEQLERATDIAIQINNDQVGQIEALERQRDELLAVLEEVRKCKSLYSMWRGRNKSRTYGAIIDAAITEARKEMK